MKVINKDQCEADQLEQQRKEIEILKISQHPHIIQLLDLFENESKIFISKLQRLFNPCAVLEYMGGGDLYDYLERRDFKISENKARDLAHRIATALFYLHQYHF